MKFKTGDILVGAERLSRGTSQGIFVFLYSGADVYNVVRIGAIVSAGKYSKEDWVSIRDQPETIRHVLISKGRTVRKPTAEEMEKIHDEMKKRVRLKKNITMILLGSNK